MCLKMPRRWWSEQKCTGPCCVVKSSVKLRALVLCVCGRSETRCRVWSRCATDCASTISACSGVADCSATICCCETSRTGTTSPLICRTKLLVWSQNMLSSRSKLMLFDARLMPPNGLLNVPASQKISVVLVHYSFTQMSSEVGYDIDIIMCSTKTEKCRYKAKWWPAERWSYDSLTCSMQASECSRVGGEICSSHSDSLTQ